MLKVIIRILFICIISVSLNFIYQVFFTYEKYNGQPILFVPHINYPVFVIVTFVIGFIFEKYIMKSKTVWALAFALLVTLSFMFIAKSIENKYGYIYEHYYQRTPFTNLTHLNEYNNQRDNRLTLGRELKDIGVKITSIEGGYTDKGHLVNDPESYQKKLYYVNEELYIIFDWDEEKITAKADKQSIRNDISSINRQINENGDRDIRFLHSAYSLIIRDENMDYKKYYIIEPTKNDTFKFTLD